MPSPAADMPEARASCLDIELPCEALATQLERTRKTTLCITLADQRFTELSLKAGAARIHDEPRRYGIRDLPAAVLFDERERHVDTGGNSSRRPDLAVLHEDRIGIDRQPQGETRSVGDTLANVWWRDDRRECRLEPAKTPPEQTEPIRRTTLAARFSHSAINGAERMAFRTAASSPPATSTVSLRRGVSRSSGSVASAMPELARTCLPVMVTPTRSRTFATRRCG